jgi:nucleoside-diphosphate-sugar epimerase
MSPITSVLITGVTGFIGSALARNLVERQVFQVRGVARHLVMNLPTDVQQIQADLMKNTDFSSVLQGIDVIIHSAARVHVISDFSQNPMAEFRKANVAAALNLARQSVAAGVKRFVFISSIKVNGEATHLGRPFKAHDAPAPLDAYGVSKMEAEQGLREIAQQTGMEVVIIRPPLVYGPGAKANFATMMRWLQRGVPLPLGTIHNQRSLVALDNLVDLIVTCLTHSAAVNQTFLVSDGEDVSTTELLRRMGQALGRPARLIPVPVSLLKLAAAMVGKQDVAQRLCGSLHVDIEKTRRLLGWTPPLTLDEGLRRAAGNTGLLRFARNDKRLF